MSFAGLIGGGGGLPRSRRREVAHLAFAAAAIAPLASRREALPQDFSEHRLMEPSPPLGVGGNGDCGGQFTPDHAYGMEKG